MCCVTGLSLGGRAGLRSELDAMRSGTRCDASIEVQAGLEQAERRLRAAEDEAAAAKVRQCDADAAAMAATEALQAATARRTELNASQASHTAAIAEVAGEAASLQRQHAEAQAAAEQCEQELCAAEARLRALDAQQKEEEALRRGESALNKAVRHLCAESEKGATFAAEVLYTGMTLRVEAWRARYQVRNTM